MNAAARLVFKPAVLEKISLLIGLAGGTGSGKTYTAMRLATGLAGGKRFAVIDTEAGRAKHYAPKKGAVADGVRTFAFDHAELLPPFRPDAYKDAILAAESAGYPVIVVDSCSHEWEGEGGILDWQEEELERITRGDISKRDACNMAAWIRPKKSHKQMVQRLLQIRAHLILCFRAEEKVEMERGSDGRMKIVPKKSLVGLNGWIPICDKRLPFELTASFLLTADAPGMPKPIKLEEQHRPFFPLNEHISDISGKRIGEWARGDAEESEFDLVVSGYARCTDEKAFAALEARRTVLWGQQLPPGQKPRLKTAADAARKNLDEAAKAGKAPPPGEPDNSEWIGKFNAHTELAKLEADWLLCTEAFGGMVPLDVSGAYESNRERLIEAAARADDM